MSSLRRRLRRDQIGQADENDGKASEGQDHSPVVERAAGELTRFGRPQSLDRPQRVEHSGNDRMTAMKLKLGHVLAGLAVRRREPER